MKRTLKNSVGHRDDRCILKVLIQLRNEQVVDVEGFSVPEDNTLVSVNGEDIKGPPESLKTVACRKRYDVEPGRPYWILRFKVGK